MLGNVKQVLFFTQLDSRQAHHKIFKTMKRFNQNRIPANNMHQSKARQSFLMKSAKRNQAIAGAFIFVVIILHFVSQFFFFPGEKFESEVTSVKTKAEESVLIKTENSARNSEIGTVTVSVPPVISSKPKIDAPPRAIIKKKEPARESRVERLRRAEKILTGV